MLPTARSVPRTSDSLNHYPEILLTSLKLLQCVLSQVGVGEKGWDSGRIARPVQSTSFRLVNQFPKWRRAVRHRLAPLSTVHCAWLPLAMGDNVNIDGDGGCRSSLSSRLFGERCPFWLLVRTSAGPRLYCQPEPSGPFPDVRINLGAASGDHHGVCGL